MDTYPIPNIYPLPYGFTECELYRGFVIATRGGEMYCGFGETVDTRNFDSRAGVRRRIDELLD